MASSLFHVIHFITSFLYMFHIVASFSRYRHIHDIEILRIRSFLVFGLTWCINYRMKSNSLVEWNRLCYFNYLFWPLRNPAEFVRHKINWPIFSVLRYPSPSCACEFIGKLLSMKFWSCATFITLIFLLFVKYFEIYINAFVTIY